MILMTDLGGRCGVLFDDEYEPVQSSGERLVNFSLHDYYKTWEKRLAERRRKRKEAQRKVKRQIQRRKHGRR
jgi:hypothetical protein